MAANVHVAFIISSEPDGHLLSLHLLPSDVLACDISPSSLGWRLTWPRMASNLVLHLLDGKLYTLCLLALTRADVYLLQSLAEALSDSPPSNLSWSSSRGTEPILRIYL